MAAPAPIVLPRLQHPDATVTAWADQLTRSVQLALQRLTVAAGGGQDTPFVTPAELEAAIADLAPKELAHVRDYGAVEDGVTNDLPAFQRAYAASKHVAVSPGKVYGIAGDLILSIEGASLVCQGGTATIRKQVPCNGVWLKAARCRLANLDIDGANGLGRPHITITGNLTSGSNTVTGVASTAALTVGDQIAGPGLNVAVTITGKTASTVTLSQNAIRSVTGAELVAVRMVHNLAGSGVIIGDVGVPADDCVLENIASRWNGGQGILNYASARTRLVNPRTEYNSEIGLGHDRADDALVLFPVSRFNGQEATTYDNPTGYRARQFGGLLQGCPMIGGVGNVGIDTADGLELHGITSKDARGQLGWGIRFQNNVGNSRRVRIFGGWFEGNERGDIALTTNGSFTTAECVIIDPVCRSTGLSGASVLIDAGSDNNHVAVRNPVSPVVNNGINTVPVVSQNGILTQPGWVVADNLRAATAGRPVVEVESTTAASTTFRRFQMLTDAAFPDALYFIGYRPSDAAERVYELNGNSGTIWHSGNLAPITGLAATRVVYSGTNLGFGYDVTSTSLEMTGTQLRIVENRTYRASAY